EVPAVGTATATDNCDTDVTVTYIGETRTDAACTDTCSLARSWRAPDNCGNFVEDSQTINVSDNTAPVITVPADATVECDEVPADIGRAASRDSETDATVTDIGETRTDGACTDRYARTRPRRATVHGG